MSLTKIRQHIRRLHEDEDGLEAVQTIMIVAIAAVILIAVMTVGQEIFDWLKEKWGNLKEEEIK
ncbi:MAG: hypothetical protein AAGA03_03035 [Planctomycetota bacterium]